MLVFTSRILIDIFVGTAAQANIESAVVVRKTDELRKRTLYRSPEQSLNDGTHIRKTTAKPVKRSAFEKQVHCNTVWIQVKRALKRTATRYCQE
ncbi:hypothetical protein RB195_018247 [Necator americanus]|uniref:Secreted protein n=1 Tax=Necator americanus TaxID=51031 RepID=A0ABR1CB71_NECAM